MKPLLPPKKYKHLLNSKWTSVEPVKGWRHYQVTDANFEHSPVQALMTSVCQSNISFWLSADNLKDRNVWMPGWKAIVNRTDE
jgi:tryptophan-rich hypothetical protein